ncbi:hypothetical protein N9A81_01860 [Synechococcus sp. AH-707-M23]|nr:hypothetical protein [Synechococcus sp. AH-707-M23]
MFIQRSTSFLGGTETVFFNTSLDDKSTWINGIYQNSMFAQFRWDPCDLKLYVIAKHFDMPKFRKCTAKTEEQAKQKVDAYLSVARRDLAACAEPLKCTA